MRHSERIREKRLLGVPVLSIAVLLLVGMACNLPEGFPLNTPAAPGASVQTSVAETLIALAVDPPGAGIGLSPSNTPSSIETLTPESSEDLVKIHMSENTNCRTGQSTSFKRVTILMQGDEAQVVGLDPSGDYYFVRLPDRPSEFCWLWSAYATPSGPIDTLPILTPVPTSTPTEPAE